MTNTKERITEQLVAGCWRIMLVEDNDLNRRLFSDYLVYCGYQVQCLADGKGLFSELVEFQPHLILLDLKLPDIDGYTLLTQLQHSTEWQHIPVIVVSAYAFRTDIQRALNLGARRYLVKPITPQDLPQAIQEQLCNCSTD